MAIEERGVAAGGVAGVAEVALEHLGRLQLQRAARSAAIARLGGGAVERGDEIEEAPLGAQELTEARAGSSGSGWPAARARSTKASARPGRRPAAR